MTFFFSTHAYLLRPARAQRVWKGHLEISRDRVTRLSSQLQPPTREGLCVFHYSRGRNVPCHHDIKSNPFTESASWIRDSSKLQFNFLFKYITFEIQSLTFSSIRMDYSWLSVMCHSTFILHKDAPAKRW